MGNLNLAHSTRTTSYSVDFLATAGNGSTLNVCTLFNPTGSGRIAVVNCFGFTSMCTDTPGSPPILRLQTLTAIPTQGAIGAISPAVVSGTGANVCVARSHSSADGVPAATAITASGVLNVSGSLATHLVGTIGLGVISVVPARVEMVLRPIVLEQGEGLLLRSTTALNSNFILHPSCAWEEYKAT